MARRARYPGEDTRLTSERELLGWYAYGLAAEIFAVCGVGSFLPVTLEQLAREQGVLRSDGVTSCLAPIPDSYGDPPGSLMRRALMKRDDNACVVRIFGSEVTTASFALYTSSASVFVQALTLVSISAIADHGDNRKRLLLTLGFTGATACMLFIFIFPDIFLLGSLLVIVSVTCLGSSNVLLNSFLPLLAANHPSIRNSGKSKNVDSIPLETLDSQMVDPAPNIDDAIEYPPRKQVLSDDNITKPTSRSGIASPQLNLSNQISATGVGIGYGSALSVQITSIILLLIFAKLFPTFSTGTLPLRVILVFIGACWATFTVPAAIWLRRRPGPPLPKNTLDKRRWLQWLSYIGFAWRSLWQTMKLAVKLRQVVVFLIAWFLLSDAVATISGTAILFAKIELNMATPAVAAVSVMATASGILGAFSWPRISKRLGLQTNRTIVFCIALMEIVPLYGLLGFLPFVKNWGVGGLQRGWEIFPLALIHGFVMGGLSSYCRSFYGLLIPPGREAAFYALYAVTDKGSSVIGPAIVGRILDATGQIRMTFWFLAVLLILPGPLIWIVDVEKGRRDALQMSESMECKFAEEQHVPRASDEMEEREGLLADD